MKYKKGDILYLKYDDRDWDIVKLLSDNYEIDNNGAILCSNVERIKSNWTESGIKNYWYIKYGNTTPYKCSTLFKLLHGINI